MKTFSLPKKVFKFSRAGLWALFLISAFPVHVWTIILVLRDFSWITERTNAWDAVGVGSYGLLIAFTESLGVFFMVVLASLLVQDCWKEPRRVVLLSVLVTVVNVWAILNQLYFLLDANIPTAAFQFLTKQEHPLRFIFIIAFILVSISVLLPVYFVLNSEKVVEVMQSVVERISLLMMIYLVFDFGSLFIVIIRNL